MKRVKEFVVLWILLIGTIGINSQDIDVKKEAEIEITAIPPVVTINLEGATAERTFNLLRTKFHVIF